MSMSMCMIEEILYQLPIKNKSETSNKYKFNCPFCGETKRRGNLYLTNNQYHCYKCNIHKNIIELSDEFGIQIQNQLYESLCLSLNKTSLFRLSNSVINYLKQKAISRSEIKKYYGLIEVYENNRSLRFIKSNLLDSKINKFLYHEKTKFIYYLNCIDESVIGFVILNLRNFGKPEQQKTYNAIVKNLNDKFSLNLSLVNESINNLTKHFNILDIDIDKKIIIFDDIINSLFYNNGIFVTSYYNIYDVHNPFYFYANNLHGLSRRLEKKVQHYSVFDWKFFLKQNKIKNKIYDLHDLKKFEKKNNYQHSLLNFFN